MSRGRRPAACAICRQPLSPGDRRLRLEELTNGAHHGDGRTVGWLCARHEDALLRVVQELGAKADAFFAEMAL